MVTELLGRQMADEQIVIPKGTREQRCPRGCGTPVWWVEVKRGFKTYRIPVDPSGPEGQEPDSLSAGRGVNHFTVCEVQQ